MYAHPWCGKGPRVLDKHGNVNTIAICRKLPPLYHMELFSMRRAVIIDKRPCRNSDGVNNEGVAIFIMANRFTVPRRFNIFRMKRIQIDVPNLRSARTNYHDFLRSLIKVEWCYQRINIETGDTDWPAPFTRTKRDFASQYVIICLLH